MIVLANTSAWEKRIAIEPSCHMRTAALFLQSDYLEKVLRFLLGDPL